MSDVSRLLNLLKDLVVELDDLDSDAETIVVDMVQYKWTESGSGSGEYYVTNSSDGSVIPEEPSRVFEAGSKLTKGTLGSLNASNYGWGNNDSLDFDTLYVRQDDGADPDGESAGQIEAEFDSVMSWRTALGTKWEAAQTYLERWDPNFTKTAVR